MWLSDTLSEPLLTFPSPLHWPSWKLCMPHDPTVLSLQLTDIILNAWDPARSLVVVHLKKEIVLSVIGLVLERMRGGMCIVHIWFISCSKVCTTFVPHLLAHWLTIHTFHVVLADSYPETFIPTIKHYSTPKLHCYTQAPLLLPNSNPTTPKSHIYPQITKLLTTPSTPKSITPCHTRQV